MSRQSATLILLACLLPLPAKARGEDCTGDPGYALTATPEVGRLGDPVDICVTAPPGDFVLLMISASPGPNDSSAGLLCVGLPLIYIVPLTVPASGGVCLPTYIHCDQAMNGNTFYAQFLSFATDGSDLSGRSNQVSVSADDDGTDCNFCTDNNKPRLLRMGYTGKGKDATKHSQKKGKVKVSGDAALTPTVRIHVQDRIRRHHKKAKVYFDGEVALGELFDIDAYAVGKQQLAGQVNIWIYDLEGQLLETVMFHTSCCQPLHGYDEFGSLKLVGFVARPKKE
jgi:hypothetical protein